MSKKILFPAILLILLTTILITTFIFCINNKKEININGTIYPIAKNILPFKLDSGNNKTLDDYDLKNHWSIVFFGYSNCPDVCPNTLNILSDFYKKVESRKLTNGKKPQVIFVTLDPNRDTANNLSEYTKFFNQKFIAASGSQATINQLITDFGVVAIKNKPDTNGDYFIDHSSHMFLINPEGQIKAIFTAPHTSDVLAKDYINIVNNYG